MAESDRQRIARLLKEKGITHTIVNDPRPSRRDWLESDLEAQQAPDVFALLYRLFPTNA